MKRYARPLLIALFTLFSAGHVLAENRIAVLSTSFVLDRKFKLLDDAAKAQGVELAWVDVDRSGEDGVRRAIDGARLVIIDAPRSDDRSQIERIAGKLLKESNAAAVYISVMNSPARLTPVNLDSTIAQRLFDFYVAGTRVNHERLFAFLKTWMAGGDVMQVEPALPLANGGIYHPGYDRSVFDNLSDYLAWWEKHANASRDGRPVIGVEISSSYISDGQTRMLDETVAALEKAGAVPLLFYRSSRGARASAPSRDAADAGAAQQRGGRGNESAPEASGRPAGGERRPEGMGQKPATERSGQPEGGGRPEGSGRPSGRPETAAAAPAAGSGFPNPKETRKVDVNEPLITLDGKVLPNVLIVNTFIGGDPERRKAWHQAMGIPVIYVLNYRQGDRAAYAKDTAGVNSFTLPFTLTQSEYIGMQDPVMLTSNELGELVPIPEQMNLLIGKVMNLAKLQTTANAEKRVALLFWNHPPGEKNQGASNLNVPRSIEHLVSGLRAEGYAFEQANEAGIIAAVADMLRPVYREGGIADLMQTSHWDFLPLASYRSWYAGLPDRVRADVEQYWGPPEKSPWLAKRDGVDGFVIPRMKLGSLIVMPQPSRGEMATGEKEKKLFHDVKIPLSHSYMATYLWIRETFAANAIVHFGTHGSQEWSPGKERGLWAYDYPQILVGNTPVVYPYIVDNISEAVHVKRRGRGVIVSHQTPAFAPAGLSDDFVRINDLLREYETVDQGPVKDATRAHILEQIRKMNIDKDLKWTSEMLDQGFEDRLRELEDYLETLGSAMQPLGLHTLGRDAEPEHMISNVMQMLGQPLYEATGVKDAREAFRGDYRELTKTKPFLFVKGWVFSERPLSELADEKLHALAEKGRKYAVDLRASWETEAVAKGLSARWIDPSYGGDPIRNPDALHTGRNMYGFDPSRVPTRAAYDAGRAAIEELIASHKKAHGKFPQKLACSVWSTETMRHLGMLEGQIFAAMGVRPTWDDGGRVTGIEVIPQSELGRPRIDPVISITGLYRDQFPNVMERFNEAIVKIAALNEPAEINPIRANSARIEAELLSRGVEAGRARNFALTRIFGNESGNYGTGLPAASLKSDQWEEKDGKLALGYLSRMSWAFGPNTSEWSEKLKNGKGEEINAYAEQLRGTDAAVFSRSSNLRGLLDMDHPFEYLGGISLAVRHLDGTSPQLYISNMRDPKKSKLETAEKFMANELRAVYQHPRWMKEMQKEGYSGPHKMLDTINNFWGWQAMDRNIVRDDQWQEFHEAYVKDRYKIGMREWFEKSNPTALAQITERMLEAIRKDYWKADEQTKRELVEVYQEIAAKHDVATSNETFKAYVGELVRGYGLETAARPQVTNIAMAAPQPKPSEAKSEDPTKAQKTVRGQELTEVKQKSPAADFIWLYLGLPMSVIGAGMLWQALQAWRMRNDFLSHAETT